MNKVWRLSDIIKTIGKYKHEFEKAQDVERLNTSHSFQSLVFHLFYYKYNSSVIIRNNHNKDRLNISIVKSKYPAVVITFEVYHKYKRLPYYFDILFLYFNNNNALNNQLFLTQHILNDNMLLTFFRYEKKSCCDH